VVRTIASGITPRMVLQLWVEMTKRSALVQNIHTSCWLLFMNELIRGSHLRQGVSNAFESSQRYFSPLCSPLPPRWGGI
jgi:hypothetical protein